MNDEDLKAITAACAASPVGKLLPSALYVHVSALSHLPALLRDYHDRAVALIRDNHADVLETANIIKLHRYYLRVSFLHYPEFETDPHPALHSALVVKLRDAVPWKTERTILWQDYRNRKSPPILHRRETFVANDHPLYEQFAAVTQDEDRLGLLSHPAIGTREAWTRHLMTLKTSDQSPEAAFERLNEQLHRDTMFSSNPNQTYSHPAYLSIVALGVAVVPCLLSEVAARRGHWYSALRDLTNANPVPDGVTNSAEQRRLWVEWGTEHGYLEQEKA